MWLRDWHSNYLGIHFLCLHGLLPSWFYMCTKVQTLCAICQCCEHEISIVVQSLQLHYGNYWAGATRGIVVTCTPSKHTCINRMRRPGTVKPKSQTEDSQTQPVFPMSSLSALAGKLVKNLCVFCQWKMSSLARASKQHHISWAKLL